MTKKQLQSLISAGMFSAALLSGAAYADDATPKTAPQQDTTPADQGTTAPAAKTDQTDPSSTDKAAIQQDSKHTTTTSKDAAQHGCGGANGCGGK